MRREIWVEWGGKLRGPYQARIVKRTEIGATMVSTIFVALDDGHLFDGPPVLFETMIFTEGKPEDYMERCSTQLEAEAQHARVVEKVIGRSAV